MAMLVEVVEYISQSWIHSERSIGICKACYTCTPPSRSNSLSKVDETHETTGVKKHLKDQRAK